MNREVKDRALAAISNGALNHELLRALLDELEAQDRLIEQLGTALQAHRADMHNTSSRPCGTCAQSAKALAALSAWKDGQMSDRTDARARG